MTAPDRRWRKFAKELLFNYTTTLLLLRQSEQNIIYGRTADRDQCYRRGGVANPTPAKAHLLHSMERERLLADKAAVEKLVASLQSGRRIDALRLQMLNAVYFKGQCSLLGAAARLGVSERTAKRWNTQALEFVAREKGWLEKAPL